MRIRGLQPRAEYVAVCELPRPGGEPLRLRMQPLRLGFVRSLRERGVVPPVPPQRIARDASGKPLRDERGQAIPLAADSDPDYVRELEMYHQRVAVLAVAESLEADADVVFETPRPVGTTGWAEYADALYAEMESAGFTAGDLVHLCEFACRLSNLGGEHLREAERRFFSPRGFETG